MRVSSISNFAVDDCCVVSINLLHICTQHHDHQPLAFNYAFGKGRNKGRGMGSCSNEGLKSNRCHFKLLLQVDWPFWSVEPICMVEPVQANASSYLVLQSLSDDLQP